MTLVADLADISVLGFLLVAFVPTSSLDDKLRIRALSKLRPRLMFFNKARFVGSLIFLELFPRFGTELFFAHRTDHQSWINGFVTSLQIYWVQANLVFAKEVLDSSTFHEVFEHTAHFFLELSLETLVFHDVSRLLALAACLLLPRFTSNATISSVPFLCFQVSLCAAPCLKCQSLCADSKYKQSFSHLIFFLIFIASQTAQV